MTKNLYRSRTHRILGGVCGGLGEYLDIDPVLVRIITILMFMLPGIGILTYIIAWIIIPERPFEEEEVETKREFSPWNNYIPGIILIAVGLFWLGHTYFWFFDGFSFWAILLILGGGALIFYSMKTRGMKNLPDPDPNHINGSNGGPLA